jgi:outer membrane beta-barrel protein
MPTLKLLTVMALLVGVASEASAQRRNPLTGQPAIRDRRELRKLRFEISPQFLVDINQDYRHAFGPGANLVFHITDWLGVGVQGSFMFNSNTALEDKVRLQLPTGNPVTDYKGGPQPLLQQHDEKVLGIDGLLSAYAQLTPFSGKFALFSAAFFGYDLYVQGGLGVVHYKQDPACCARIDPPPAAGSGMLPDPNTGDARIFAGFKVGGMIAVGAHVFFNDFIGIQLELRDYIVGANPGGADVNGDRLLKSNDESIQNNIFFGVGVTIMLPPRAKITH